MKYIFTILLLVTSSLYSEIHRVVLEPQYLTLISSEVTSTVTNVNRRMGQSFKEGELILSLDDQLFQANHKKAVANLARAKAVFEAQKALFSDKAASLTELKQAEADFATAEAELVIAKNALEACRIIGPYNGKVQELFIQVHERVEPGQKLVETLDDEILVAKFLVSSSLLNELSVGQEVTLLVKETKESYPAKIARVAAAINPASSLVEVDAEVDNSSGALTAGMIGTIEIGRN